MAFEKELITLIYYSSNYDIIFSGLIWYEEFIVTTKQVVDIVKVTTWSKDYGTCIYFFKSYVNAGKQGDYYRLLLDGDYKVRVVAEGFHPEERCITVANKQMQQAQVVNFDLTPSNKERTKGQTGCIPTKQLDLSSGTEQFLQDSLYDKVRLDENVPYCL